MNRTEMRRCGKPFDSEAAVERSKTWTDGATAVECRDPDCGRWHMEKPRAAPKALARKAEMPARSAEPRVKVPAQRAKPGSMKTAVADLLSNAGYVTLAEIARAYEVDPDRLWDAAWKAARDEVKVRDEHECRACGEHGWHVHHRRRRGAGSTSDTSISLGFANLVLMCAACHAAVHAADPDLRDRGFRLIEGEIPSEKPVFVHAEYGYMRTWLKPDGSASHEAPERVAA